MDTRIITLPIKAYKKDKIGLLVIPTFSEMLKSKTGFKTTLALNLSDSFEDRYKYINNYYNLIKDMNIKLDDVWIDSRNREKLLNELNTLIELGFIKEKFKTISFCKCHKVEIENKIIETLAGKCFNRKDGKLICNYCNEEIQSTTEKCLVFESPKNTTENIITIPQRISKQMKELDKKISGNDIIISRKRETGYKFSYNNNLYNIDVDFIWQNYLSTIGAEDKKMIVGSNHTIYAMYMINLLERSKGHNNLIFIALPHVKGLENIDFKNLNLQTKKMVLTVASSKMKEPNSKWDNELYNYIERSSQERKEFYFKCLYEKNPMNEGESIENYINRILVDDMNFQKIIKKAKGYER